MNRRHTLLSLAVAGLVATLGTAVQAQADYPNKPIKLIVDGPAGGINDIRNDVTGATLATTVQTFIGTLTADSRTVIFINLSPFGNNVSWTSGRQTQLVAYNSAMATWCGTHPAVTCVDMYTVQSAGGGSPQNLKAANDSGDGLHWNGTGGQAAADQVFAQAP